MLNATKANNLGHLTTINFNCVTRLMHEKLLLSIMCLDVVPYTDTNNARD